MKSVLINALEPLGFPIYLQGSLADKEYPKAFFTFWNYDTPEDLHFDNVAVRAIWNYWISFYADDPETVETVTNDAVKKLKEAGFILTGKGEDAATDDPDFTARRLTASFIEKY